MKTPVGRRIAGGPAANRVGEKGRSEVKTGTKRGWAVQLTRGSWVSLGLLVLAGGVAAGPRPARGEDQVPAAAQQDADSIFKSRCAACHGADGKGDGPLAPTLNPPPANFASAAFQKAVDDATLDKAIRGGGEAVGKSPLMPGNPDLEGKPDVVKALRLMIRKFGAGQS